MQNYENSPASERWWDLLQPGSFKLMKKMNQQVILKLIYDEEAISRAEIAERTGLSPATVTNIVRGLMEMGLIKETHQGESRGGRKPVLLELNPEGAYFIGLEWGIAEVRGVLLNLRKKVIAYEKEKVENFQLDSFIELSARIVNKFLIYSKEEDKIYGLGIGVHGMVDPERGNSLFAPHFKWKDLPVKKELEKRINLPVLIDNDVRVMAIAEKWNDRRNFILVNTGPGIGAAIVLNGKLHYGRDYSAGEFGHMTVMRDGPLCSCGNTGCLEALISTENLLHNYHPELSKKVSRQDLHELWLELLSDGREGKREALNIIEEIAEYLGIGLANLVNLLNPEEILLAGDFTEAVDLLLPLLKKEISKRSLLIPGRELIIGVTEFGHWVGAMGGATMVLQQLFNLQEGI